MKIIDISRSRCNSCFKDIPAEVCEVDGMIRISKSCPEHGVMTAEHNLADPADYVFFKSLPEIPVAPSVAFFHITSRCNLYCSVCFVRAGDYSEDDISYERIRQADLAGFATVQITGGEPTMRSDLPEIIRLFKEKRKRVCVLSNGIRLNDEAYARKLKEAGLDFVILQFDTFNEATSRYMRGEHLLPQKLGAIKNLVKADVALGLFVVLIKGKNMAELPEFFGLLNEHPDHIKFIYLNRLTEIGRFKEAEKLTISEMFREVERVFGLTKQGFCSATEFVFGLSCLLRKKYFSKCAYVNFFLLYRQKAIPLDSIFNIRRYNRWLRALRKLRMGFLFWPLFVVDGICLNFLRNRYFRVLLRRFILNIRKFSWKNKALVSPLHAIFIGSHQGLANFDASFETLCHKRIYSVDEVSLKKTCCSYYIKKSSCHICSIQKETPSDERAQ